MDFLAGVLLASAIAALGFLFGFLVGAQRMLDRIKAEKDFHP
jgi:hypothetical protein